MVIVSIFLGFIIINTFIEGFKWQESLYRLLVSFLIFTPAAYFSKESNSHRQQQNKYLRMSLKLKVIDPFISQLEKKEKTKIKGELAKSMFGDNKEEDTYSVEVGLQSLVKEAVSNGIKKAMKTSNTAS